MKTLNLLLTLMLFQWSSAQNFEGVVKDLTTNEPIEMVSVFVENTGSGTVTNVEGQFRISAPSPSQVIKFTHLNYKSFTLKADDLAKFSEILLEPNSFALDEVVVLHKPIPEILKTLIANSKRKVEKGVIIDTYYREFVKYNNIQVSYSDALIQYHIKSKSGAADSYVDQSRVIKTEEVLDKNIDDISSMYDIREAISKAYNVKIAKSLMNSKHYEYVVRKVGGENQNLIRIDCKPAKGFKVRLLEGSITYDATKNLILEIDMQSAKGFEEYAMTFKVMGFRVTINNMVQKTNFRIEGDKYIMVYNQNNMNFTLSENEKYNGSYDLMSDVVTLKYAEGDFNREKAERYNKRNLFSAGNNYTTEFWNGPNTRIMTLDEQRELNKLK